MSNKLYQILLNTPLLAKGRNCYLKGFEQFRTRGQFDSAVPALRRPGHCPSATLWGRGAEVLGPRSRRALQAVARIWD